MPQLRYIVDVCVYEKLSITRPHIVATVPNPLLIDPAKVVMAALRQDWITDLTLDDKTLTELLLPYAELSAAVTVNVLNVYVVPLYV